MRQSLGEKLDGLVGLRGLDQQAGVGLGEERKERLLRGQGFERLDDVTADGFAPRLGVHVPAKKRSASQNKIVGCIAFKLEAEKTSNNSNKNRSTITGGASCSR